MKPLLIAIAGPTAAGKTDFAIRLAQELQTEILSFDSRQFFRELTIGTAKPTEEELSRVPHHFINSHSVHDEFNAGSFEKAALLLLDDLFTRFKVIVAVGGSGLYLNALIKGLDLFPDVSSQSRAQVDCIWQERGLEGLQEMLKLHDPVYALTADLQNYRRLVRALEVSLSSGKPYSSFIRDTPATRNFNTLSYCLNPEREVLYARINARVDQMMENGLLAEAEQWKHFRNLNPLRTVGYTELFRYMDGECSLAESIDAIKQNSRRYAKRQLTWFRHQESVEWVGIYDLPRIASLVKSLLNP